MEPRRETMITFFNNQEQEEHWPVHISKADHTCCWCNKPILKGEECFWPVANNGMIHIECAKFKASLRPTWWIAEKLGITSNQFKRLIKNLNFMPGDYYENHYKRYVPLWDQAIIDKMKDTIGVIGARSRLSKKRRVQL